jgi:hypothetical protein
MLGLLAVCASAFMAFAATASADEVTDAAGNTVTNIHATSEGHAILHAPFGTVECNSTVSAHVTHNGGVVTAHVTTLDFTSCTEEKTVTVLQKGTLELDVTGTNTGTLRSSGAEITVRDDVTGVNCIYTTKETGIGTATGGTPGKLDIGSSTISRTGHSFFCGSSGTWTGTYKVTSPTTVHLDP